MAAELPHLIWIDCEMTGLSLEKDVLVEIAVLVTDSEMNVIGDGIDLVIKATPEQLAGMNEFVTQMHTASSPTASRPKKPKMQSWPTSKPAAPNPANLPWPVTQSLSIAISSPATCHA